MSSFSSSFPSLLDWKLAMLSSGLVSSSGRQNQRRKRRRCTPNKYITKPEVFLVLGVLVLVALPHWAFCRPVDQVDAENVSKKDFHVYAHSSVDDVDNLDDDGLLASSSVRGSSLNANNDDDDEITSAAREDSSRFEFRKKIPTSSSSNEPDAYDKIKYGSASISNNNNGSRNVHSLEVIQSSNKNKDNSLLGGNSSMIVHVIVTSSSSSTSGGRVELDETDIKKSSKDSNRNILEGGDHIQFRVSGDDDDDDDVDDEESIVAESSSDSHVSTASSAVKSSAVKTTILAEDNQDLKQKANGDNDSSRNPPKTASQSSDSFHGSTDTVDNDEKLELKKLPKSEHDSPDIFSAFYRAFSETSPTSPIEKTPSFPGSPTAEDTVTSFRLPTRSDFRQRPSSFQLFQQRRRLYRNRQLAERKSTTLSSSSSPSPVITERNIYDSYSKSVSGLGNVSVEDTARKLEFLAKKLDKSEREESFRGQQDKILAVSSSSSSSLITTTTQVPFLLSQPSLPSSFVSPPKIAVSVTHTKSVVASASATTAAATTRRREESLEATKQKVVGGGVKNNAKSETTTFPGSGISQQERDKNHGTYSYFSRPRPLIKSLPRNEDGDQQNDNINNKNASNNHIFQRNFSTHGREEDSAALRKTYGSGGDRAEGSSSTLANGNGKSIAAGERNTRNSGDNSHNDKVNEDNFRIQDRFNIISFSRDGSESTSTSDLLKTSTFAIPSAQPPSSLFEVTTIRPSAQQSKKITRTVSSEIGDPSTFFFNVNTNYRSTPRSSSKVPAVQKTEQTIQSTPKPATNNWQQPGRVWSEPAQVWGVPAKVWGEPARVWSEPAKVWSEPGKNWATKLEDEMMQSDQPPEDRKAENEDEIPSQGTFVILGDDENEGDSIDGDLGRPLMLHHFTVPPNKQKETVSVRTSVSSSVSSNNKNDYNNSSLILDTYPFSRSSVNSPTVVAGVGNSRVVLSNSNINTSNYNNSDSSNQQAQNKKSGKKFGYVIEGANVRKYRVEERTPDGFIIGEYGVLNNQNAFLRGVRYTADGTINPRLIHEALMKFLSLRR